MTNDELDRAVAIEVIAAGVILPFPFSPSTDWQAAGPAMDRLLKAGCSVAFTSTDATMSRSFTSKPRRSCAPSASPPSRPHGPGHWRKSHDPLRPA